MPIWKVVEAQNSRSSSKSRRSSSSGGGQNIDDTTKAIGKTMNLTMILQEQMNVGEGETWWTAPGL